MLRRRSWTQGIRYERGHATARIAVALVTALVISLAGAVGSQAQIAAAHASSAAPARAASSSPLRVRAAFAPFAIMVCTRLCPVAGAAAWKIVQRAPKQIRAVPAPKPLLAQQFRAAAGSAPGQTLGLALVRGNAAQAAALRAQGLVAHHIVAHGHPRAEFARMVLQARGIGPNSAANGVWLKASVHFPVHSNAYFQNVNRVVGKYYFNQFEPTSHLIRDLQQVGRLLRSGKFPL